jgi:DNA-binding NtrC family response regulator
MEMMQQRKQALVVEDQQLWRELFFGEALEDMGFKVFPAATKEEALDLLDKHTFDVAVIDINLTEVPGNSDGVLVTDYIERKGIWLPIIVVSGSEDGLRALSEKRHLIHAEIRKDAFNLDEFVAEVAKAVEQTQV